eukprot:scaffold6722_cov173-Amphora_coffeaeformis.AAC.9
MVLRAGIDERFVRHQNYDSHPNIHAHVGAHTARERSLMTRTRDTIPSLGGWLRFEFSFVPTTSSQKGFLQRLSRPLLCAPMYDNAPARSNENTSLT